MRSVVRFIVDVTRNSCFLTRALTKYVLSLSTIIKSEAKH